MRTVLWSWAWAVDDFGHRRLGPLHRPLLWWLCDLIDRADQVEHAADVDD